MTLTDLIQYHRSIHENLEIADVYKLLYQGVFGPAHLLQNSESAKAWLEMEFTEVDPNSTEPLTEPVSLDGEIIRVNLKPFKMKGGLVEKLFQAMVLSAREIKGNRDDFLKLWNEFKRLVEEGELQYDWDELKAFDREISEDDLPVIHHSRDYTGMNKPAYRVVRRKIFEKMLDI
ncbi:hypothetical protein ISS37_01810 [candidate division KSB1 bacterium]|nr:hypothetical protein [candidate division KSB1 bacterium]